MPTDCGPCTSHTQQRTCRALQGPHRRVGEATLEATTGRCVPGALATRRHPRKPTRDQERPARLENGCDPQGLGFESSTSMAGPTPARPERGGKRDGAMPYAPPARCHCGAIATRRGRCDDHQPKPWSTPSANTQALTGRQRAQFKAAQLAREPQCRICGSTDDLQADHIIPVAEGGALLSPSNGQTLCRVHHEAKSRAERQRGRARSRRKG